MTTNTTAQKPTVCRIVLYFPQEMTPSPAIVTHVNADGSVDLHVFGDLPEGGDGPMRRRVLESTTGAPGTWSWPPRA